MTKTIFIFAYYSFKDPIFQSAVLPYFVNLSDQGPFRFVLLTFEQRKHKLSYIEKRQIKEELEERNIFWYSTNWHSGFLKPVKKVFDFFWGIVLSLILIARYKINAIYSEGFPGAIFGFFLSLITHHPHIIHTYEPHTDYMVEAGVWKRGSWEAVLLRYFEKRIANQASHIMTATNAMIDKLRGSGIKAQLHRVPSCVDTYVFKYSQNAREDIRKRLGITAQEKVIVYLGKFGGMYFDQEVIDFFSVVKHESSHSFKFIILTNDDHQQIYDWLQKYSIEANRVYVASVLKHEVPSYLSASDFGFVPVRQYPGKRFCSPIKDGEYWACGLPIIIYEGISDDYLIAQQHQLGIVVKSPSTESYKKTVKEIDEWVRDNSVLATRRRTRDFVVEDRSVKKFQVLYVRIFNTL